MRQEKGANQHTKKEEAQHCATTGKSSKQTAEVLGVSARKVEQARTIQDHADEETVQAVKDGDMSINKAYNETQARRRGESKENIHCRQYAQGNNQSNSNDDEKRV